METRKNKGRARLPVKRDGRCKTLLPAPQIPREGSHPAWAERRARATWGKAGCRPEREPGPTCRDAPDCRSFRVRNKAEGLSGLNPFWI